MYQKSLRPGSWLLVLLCVGLLACLGCPKDDDDDPVDLTTSLLWSATTLTDQINAGNVVVLDCRKVAYHTDGTTYIPYDEEHITGSFYFDFFLFGDPYPDTADLSNVYARLGEVGIQADTCICLVDAGIANPQGKVFFYLEHIGCTNVHILDGGHPNWTSVGGSVSTTATTLPATVTFTPTIDDTCYWQLAEMKACYDSYSSTTHAIIDYREEPLFYGHKICPDAARHGHIPNTVLLDWHDYYDGSTGLFKTKTDIQTLTEAVGGSASKINVVICNKGWRSGIAYFALRHIGWPKSAIRHYCGGIREWAAESSTTHPMDTDGCYTYDPTEKMPDGSSAARRLAGAFAQVGSTVYCIGGYTANSTGGVYSSAVQAYNIQTGAWTTTDPASLPAARAFAAAGTDGTDIWVFGGLDSSGTVTNTIYKYTVSGDTWSTETATLPAGRFSFAAASVGTSIFLGGGLTSTVSNLAANYSDDFYEFDTLGVSCTSRAALPGTGTTTHGRRCHALTTDGTDVYLVGGFWYDEAQAGDLAKKDLSDLHFYDVSADSWSTLASMPAAVAGHAAVHLGSGATAQIVVPGGWCMAGTKADVYAYDVTTDSWETLMVNGRKALCAWPRYWYFIGAYEAASISDIAVIGGYSAGTANIMTTPNGGKTHFNQAYIYDMTSIFD